MSVCSNFGDCLQEYLVRKVRASDAKRSARIAAMQTKAEADVYVAEVRAKIRNIFALPSERCDLAPVVTGVEQRAGFRIEKIIYHSRKNYPVTANLYVPDHADNVPAVLFLCGHSNNGKAFETYQICSQGLALKGFAVLTIDAMGQGERRQFLDEPYVGEVNVDCTREHNMIGKELMLSGESFGAWCAWDGMRGIDYLLTRPEVDSTRIGVTGTSGGGTMTSILGALDDRIAMIAPGCYITTWRHNIENELPADIEQIPNGILAAGCEMGDWLIAQAPRPAIILGQSKDYFDVRGLHETYAEVKKIYGLLGAGENLERFVSHNSHGYSVENREAMYRFFARHAYVRNVDAKESKQVQPLPDTMLYCTPDGLAKHLPGERGIREMIAEAADVAGKRRTHRSGEQLRNFFAERFALRRPAAPYYRILRSKLENDGSPLVRLYGRFALETEPDMLAVLKVVGFDTYIPALKKALLYIPDLDAQSEMLSLEQSEDTLLCGLDTRGVGELTPNGADQTSREFFATYLYDYHYASCALLFDDPLPTARARDIWSAVELLKSQGVTEITLAAYRLGCIPAAIAALMIPEVKALNLCDAPQSWNAMTQDAVTVWPESAMLPGILNICDLPDIYRVLREEKKLTVRGLLDNRLCKCKDLPLS